jgi:hypothetical protein
MFCCRPAHASTPEQFKGIHACGRVLDTGERRGIEE